MQKSTMERKDHDAENMEEEAKKTKQHSDEKRKMCTQSGYQGGGWSRKAAWAKHEGAWQRLAGIISY